MATKQTKRTLAQEPEATAQAASKTAAGPTERPTRDLAPVQQLIADEVGYMLVHGGHEQDTQLLVLIAFRNMWQRYYDNLGPLNETPAETRKRVGDLAGRDYPESIAELRMEWKRNRAAKAEDTIEPKTATECIRANVIDTLQCRFEDFVVQGTPEEHRLMLDILQDREANGWRDNSNELSLGKAFDYALGKSAPDWVKVPSEMRKQVEQYIKCLEAAEMKDCNKSAA
ncbi:MAG: hypothetical protein P4L40_09855 [Terracidiphilus sp.]|nr:hypothetical protein [Terracidiphilus sp.]